VFPAGTQPGPARSLEALLTFPGQQVSEQFGARTSMIAGGVISVIATAALGCLLARSRGVRVREYLRPAELARIVA